MQRDAGVVDGEVAQVEASSGPGLTPTKLALRRTVRDGRAAGTDAGREATARALAMVALEMPPLRAAGCVALYASRTGEPGTGPLRAALRGRGTRVLLPVVVAGTVELDWAEDDGADGGADDVVGAFGVAEPAGPRLGADALAAADVVLTPAMAVDTAGTRLGHGRGFYDRALRRARPDALVIAVVHDAELLDADRTPIPRAVHDVPVHAALTPSRWIFFADRSG